MQVMPKWNASFLHLWPFFLTVTSFFLSSCMTPHNNKGKLKREKVYIYSTYIRTYLLATTLTLNNSWQGERKVIDKGSEKLLKLSNSTVLEYAIRKVNFQQQAKTQGNLTQTQKVSWMSREQSIAWVVERKNVLTLLSLQLLQYLGKLLQRWFCHLFILS